MRISDWSSDVCSSDLPTSRQGLRTNHRLSNRLAVHRINPALHTPYRKSMTLHEIVLNQTLCRDDRLPLVGAGALHGRRAGDGRAPAAQSGHGAGRIVAADRPLARSEEPTSELQ